MILQRQPLLIKEIRTRRKARELSIQLPFQSFDCICAGGFMIFGFIYINIERLILSHYNDW